MPQPASKKRLRPPIGFSIKLESTTKGPDQEEEKKQKTANASERGLGQDAAEDLLGKLLTSLLAFLTSH